MEKKNQTVQWLTRRSWLNPGHLPKMAEPDTFFVTTLTGCSLSWLKWARYNEENEFPIKMEKKFK